MVGVVTAIYVGIAVAAIGTAASIWSSNQQQINQQKRQSGLLKDAQTREQQEKQALLDAETKSQEDAKKRSLKRQRSISDTVLTGPKGAKDEADKTLGKQSLLGA